MLLSVPRRFFFCGSSLLFVFRVCICQTVLSVAYNLAVNCWERADLLALLCVMFSCVFVTFRFGVLVQICQMWFSYLIVSIPDLCLPLYYDYNGNLKLLAILLFQGKHNITVY